MSQQKPKETEGGGGAGSGPVRKLPFEARQLKTLVDLMVENDLTRLELREGETHILLRRGLPPGNAGAVTYMPAAMTAPPPSRAAAPDPAAPPVAAENELLIRSPMVGTFYSGPEPEAPPFVSVGATVTPDTVVCLLEAMKVFNEIKAEVSGRVTKVLVKNAQAVEFDQPLFALAPV